MKMLVQKHITVTLELNEKEVTALRDLLNNGLSTETINALGLLELHKSLIKIDDLSQARKEFAIKAELK